MPQFVAYVGAYLMLETGAMALGAFLLGNAALIATAATLLGGMAYSSSQASKARKQAKEQYNAAQVDRMANIVASKAPRELVMGRVRKAGSVFYRASTGKDLQELYVAVALAAHEIDAVEGYYLNDELVTIDGSGYVQEAPYSITTRTSKKSATYPTSYVAGTVTPYYDESEWGTGAIIGYNYQEDVVSYTVQITIHKGQAGQTANASLIAAFPADWTAANLVQGVSYILIKASYNETAFPSGFPVATVVLRGAKLYDPRTGLTVWSENPALMMRHVYTHPSFGKATSVTTAEDARIIAAANACDTSTVYTVGGVAQPARALYKAAIVLPYGASASSAFDDLSQAMGGSWAFAGGELHMKAGVYTAPVMALTEADLAVIVRNGASETQKPIGISVHSERARKFNTVKSTIWDNEQDYKQTALTALTSAALVTRDGAELTQEVTFPAIGYAPQAQHIAGILMRDARDALVVEMPFKLRVYPLELFDVVTLTIARYGWTNKQFMILSRTWTADGSITLTMKETSAAITQMDAGFLAQGFAANTNLPKPWSVQKVGALTVTSGTAELIKQADGTIVSRMRVAWPQVTDKAVQQNGKIEVQYRRSDSSGAWESLIADGDDTQIVTQAVEDGIYYIVRARAKTSLAVGDWNTQVQHQVIGKTEAPPYVTRFKLIEQPGNVKQFFWEMDSKPMDLFAFEVRYSLGTTERAWDAMIPLFVKDSQATSHENQEPANDGTYTFAVKGVDTSGIYSALPHYITETLDGDVFGPVKLLVLPQELDWLGTKVDCYIDGTELGPLGSMTWADLNMTWTAATGIPWRGTLSPAFISYEHPTVDTGASIERTIRASALVGGVSTIEYSHSLDDVTYSAWAEVPTTPMTSRYFKFRWTVTGTWPRIYRAQVVFY